jgi:phosphatidylglycerol---prolipoprotein diacylglyceryl transferase
MLPYFALPTIHLVGPLSLQPFGALFAIGLLCGYLVIMRGAKADGVPPGRMQWALAWMFTTGLFTAHLAELLFYQPDTLRHEGISAVLHVFTGLSSIGAFTGGLAALWIYSKWRRISGLTYLAIILQGFVAWWAFVRAGCAISHDHLGTRSNFFLAVNYPEGARHNLGLDEFLVVVLVLVPLTILCHRWHAQPKTYVATIFVAYGASRFGLEFLRATDLVDADPRYWGLTAAQYGCGVLLAAGLFMALAPRFLRTFKVMSTQAAAMRLKHGARI